MLDKNVMLVKSRGANCGICGHAIKRDEQAVRVVFEVPLLFTSTNVDRELHLECAESLATTVRRRLHEAGWR